MGEPNLHHLLNWFVAARRAATTYMYSLTKRVALAFGKVDSMAIKRGSMTDEATMQNFGGLQGPYDVKTAALIAEMDDATLWRWLTENPLAQEIDEFMIASADNTVVGHLGCNQKGSGGGASAVVKMVSKFVPLAACFACMEAAFDQGKSMADAESACDMYCVHQCTLPTSSCTHFTKISS